ncbi:cytochrome P450 4c21-like [Toxorhynchites rutilus septentrionalis]|uniref:cytochrome P450 4c21-like n=1 Tax=Toxorhynchites rutilus septentrionalis TaxID=329112 RepID=UPI002479549B|nr:cytochrome P450 4c21-like [Toxorhynchites rutilus septentrionalis]
MGAALLFLPLMLIIILLIVTVRFLRPLKYAQPIPIAPFALPLVGHLLRFIGNTSERGFWSIISSFEPDARLTKLMFGPLPVILVQHPDLVQAVLRNEKMYDKPFPYDFFHLRHGLICERDGERWKQTRRLLNPAFKMKVLAEFVPIFDSRARKLVDTLKPLADGSRDINLVEFVTRSSHETIFSTSLGCNVEGRPGENECFENFELIQNCVGMRLLRPELFLEPVYRLCSNYDKEKKSRAICTAFVDKLIQERCKKLSDNNNDSEENIQSHIFMDNLLHLQLNGQNLSDRDISDHLHTLMIAGYETSALTICYTCLALAQHPDIQNNVVAELRDIFHSPSVELNLETLNRLEYTEMVIKETMRLFPVIPIIARETGAPIVLDGVRIPRKQVLIMSFHSLHRRKDCWGDEPDRFDPERFRAEACQARHPYAYLPFSGGYRNCIGNRYGMISLKTALTRLLLEYEIRTNIKRKDMRFRYEISMRLVGPYTVQLIKRS